MQVKQLYTILSETIIPEVLGDADVLNEDLSNIVDVGSAIFNANAVDNYVKSLVDRIGKEVFVTRKYEGNAPSISRDDWEYGSVIQKVRANLLKYKKNESWDLTDGETYPAHVFYKPTVGVKYFNGKTTFDVPCSFTEVQLKESFTSASKMNSFISMIYNAIDQTLTVATDELAMRTVNLMMAVKLDNETANPGGVVHLVAEYNDFSGETETDPKVLLHDTNFLKFCAQRILLTSDRMTKIGKFFNIGDFPTFTPKANQKMVLLDQFASSLDVYMQADTYHDEYTKIGSHDIVSFWQGAGDGGQFLFADCSAIDVKHETAITNAEDNTIEQTAIVGVLFDEDACLISQFDRRVTSEYTASAEFYTNYNKQDAHYIVDPMENAVVFVLD